MENIFSSIMKEKPCLKIEKYEHIDKIVCEDYAGGIIKQGITKVIDKFVKD